MPYQTSLNLSKDCPYSAQSLGRPPLLLCKMVEFVETVLPFGLLHHPANGYWLNAEGCRSACAGASAGRLPRLPSRLHRLEGLAKAPLMCRVTTSVLLKCVERR